MFPIRDSVPGERAPVMLWTLITVNTLVFFYEQSLTQQQLDVLMHTWGLVPRALLDPGWALWNGLPPGSPLVLVTNTFLHGGWGHFLSNMWFLFLFGDNVEDRMGPARFLVFYLLAGVGASLIHLLFNMQSALPALGASGAISGVLGAYWRLFPTSRILTLVPIFFYPMLVEIYSVFFIGFWFMMQLFQGLGSLGVSANMGGVAWWAHVGGFVMGLVLYRMFLLPSHKDGRDWPI
jgi:membrane associated rhomboid family serine protease